jgi:intein/homing endonuclease
MAGGLVKPAGHLAPGDLVCTVPDGGGTLGSFRVRDALIHVRNRVRLALSDGRDLVCSPNHPVMAGGRWREVQTLRPGDGVDGLRATVLGVFPAPSGEVVRLSVDGAQTYCANGILSHNLKAID